MKSSRLLSKLAPVFFRGSLGLSLVAAYALNAADTAERDLNTQGSGAVKLQQNADASAPAKPGDAASFIKAAIKGNQAEVALAQVAERNAQSSEVKQFAAMLQKEHTEANQKLQSIAQAHGVTLNQPVDSKDQKKLEQFQKLSGAEFDKEYVKDMLKDHQKDIRTYEQASEQFPETDVKQYVQSTLPTLREHLQHAKHAAQAIGIDQATISSLTKDSEPMGGTADHSDQNSGSATRDKD